MLSRSFPRERRKLMNNSTSLRGLERKPQVHLFEIFMFQFLERFYFGPGSIIIDYRSKRTTENSSILMRKTELKSQDIKHDKKKNGEEQTTNRGTIM